MDKTSRRRSHPGGGRPLNEERYPEGETFNAQAFRNALTHSEISLRELVRVLNEEQGVSVHRSSVWRWTQYRLYVDGAAPPLAVLRALERVLECKLTRTTG